MNRDVKIFISYRRADNPCFAERIRDWFMLVYKRENVFMDFDAIPPFVDFEAFIIEQIKKIDVMLVIIGQEWLSHLKQREKSGTTDYVRLEIKQALAMGKLVAPILVDGATMPRANQLPEDIRPMLRANVPRLDGGRQFLDNIERIVSALPQALNQHVRIQTATPQEAERMVDPMESMQFYEPARQMSRTASAPPPPTMDLISPSLEEETASPEAVRAIVALCHAPEDFGIALRVERDLTAQGVGVRANKIPDDAVLVIVLMSPHGRHSDWIHGQIEEAHAAQKPILPVLVAGDTGSAMPYAVAANEMIDLRNYPTGIEALRGRVEQFID
ncbi:MAG: toll/interleukin-1 receptor domain-containing protein [Anaerolineaceae bacterium]|nr:MAG: toll/interleukin-1 receptor domain-containing protein [Anaerolineaceae bacterium]